VKTQTLGIDLGGADLRVAFFNGKKGCAEMAAWDQGANRIPAIVCANGTKLIAGREAEDFYLANPGSGLFYHQVKFILGQGMYDLGGRQVNAAEVADTILAELKNQARKLYDLANLQVVVTHPLGYDPIAQEVLRQAAARAGFLKVVLLSEPEAAVAGAINSGAVVGKTVLVCDIGAISSTISVLTRGAEGTYSPLKISRTLPGGCDLVDRTMYGNLATAMASEPSGAQIQNNHNNPGENGATEKRLDPGLFHVCKQLRKQLVTTDKFMFNYKGATFEIHRDKLVSSAQRVFEDIQRVVNQAMQEAMNLGQPVESILLTGGGSTLPFAQELLGKRLPQLPLTVADSDNLVALGAVRHLHRKSAPANDLGEDPLEAPNLKASIKKIKKKIKEQDQKLVFLLAGRWGVGKSSTINSLLGAEIARVDHHEQGTFEVTPYPTEFAGIPLVIVDTPGLCDAVEENSNDKFYLEKMGRTVKEIHSLWYVTKLIETRPPGPDELRAIRVLSEAFEQKGAIWKSAVVIFTFSNSDIIPSDRYETTLQKKTEQFRRAIAVHAGEEVANSIPFVPVDNSSHTVRKSRRKWRDILYAEVCLTIDKDRLLVWMIATQELLKKKNRKTPEKNDDNDDSYEQKKPKYEKINIPEEKLEPIRERVEKGFFTLMGEAIGEAVDEGIKAVKGFWDWLTG
jgi:GTP-binding protein EngB required for normal cell division